MAETICPIKRSKPAFGKQQKLQSRVKEQIPRKGTASANSWAFDVWKSWAPKYIFVSRTGMRSCFRAYDFTPENWIIGYRFSLWKYVDRTKDIHPIRYLIWLLVFSVLFARNISE